MKKNFGYTLAMLIIALPIVVFFYLQTKTQSPDTSMSFFKTLSPNNEFLIYDIEDKLQIYNFKTKNTKTLTTFYGEIEGLECIRNENNTDIACVEINQQAFPGLTKFIIMQIDKNGNLITKKEFVQDPGESVDFVCGGNCYPGNFRFTKEKTVKYDGHNIINPGEIFEISY